MPRKFVLPTPIRLYTANDNFKLAFHLESALSLLPTMQLVVCWQNGNSLYSNISKVEFLIPHLNQLKRLFNFTLRQPHTIISANGKIELNLYTYCWRTQQCLIILSSLRCNLFAFCSFACNFIRRLFLFWHHLHFVQSVMRDNIVFYCTNIALVPAYTRCNKHRLCYLCKIEQFRGSINNYYYDDKYRQIAIICYCNVSSPGRQKPVQWYLNNVVAALHLLMNVNYHRRPSRRRCIC